MLKESIAVQGKGNYLTTLSALSKITGRSYKHQEVFT